MMPILVHIPNQISHNYNDELVLMVDFVSLQDILLYELLHMLPDMHLIDYLFAAQHDHDQ